MAFNIFFLKKVVYYVAVSLNRQKRYNSLLNSTQLIYLMIPSIILVVKEQLLLLLL